MSLSVNPVTKFLNDVQAAAGKATNAVGNLLGFNSNSPAKSDLDAKVSRAGAGFNSPLNGTTGGGTTNVEGTFGTSSSVGGTNGSVQTYVGGVRSALSQAGQNAGAISNVAANAAGAINALTGGEASAGGVGSGLLQAAGAISAAAGVLNNILSLGRAKNLPSGAELFQQIERINVTPALEGDWRVRINCDFNTLFGSGTFPRLAATRGLVFPFTPNMNISSKANYSTIDPVHSNFPFQAYKNSQVDDITISGDFPAETSVDGQYYLEATSFLRSATKMFYGQGNFAGNPPIVCTLSGYGPMLLNNVPVVVKSFQIELKDDVNYIEVTVGGKSTWVPVLSTLTVTLMPVYNRERLRKFNLQNFAAGKEIGLI